MARPTLIADTGPLIHLASIRRLDLLDELFEVILVPFDVWGELAHRPDAPEPVQVLSLERIRFTPPVTIEAPRLLDLGVGERQVIAVGRAHRETSAVALDDKAARTAARDEGLFVIGTVGLLLEAKRRGHLATLRPLLEELVANGAWLHVKLIEAALTAAGEA